MCDFSPFASFQSTQPAWVTDYNLSAYAQRRRTSTISPKTSIYGPAAGRRGAIVACVEDHETQLEQIRRGSISTVFNTMSFQEKAQQLPMPISKPSATYMESMLSPPSSPRSASPLLHEHIEVPEHVEERVYNDRRFQRQIMSRLQALNHFQGEEEVKEEIRTPETKLTPPPSPRQPFLQLDIPTKQSDRCGNGSGSKKRARSLRPANNFSGIPTTLPSPSIVSSQLSKGGRRVSAPGTITSATATSHKSARGAVKKVSSSASSSRRGSSKGLEVLREGTLFKSGWSWASAYENGSTATMEEGPKCFLLSTRYIISMSTCLTCWR
ncbi:hypothetical protein L211DRAFT_724123 [Terfezia boudieri ATCC MYA-4762]|uniref:Uncharacterized protein n=1 Tax=Terfezia boudieri ATCC MYA-4762 TaxID=1051890 RepID=A0A3N4LCX6_9PEZI|nr:hypothetical protein L211DRAFT_724123 [Terfezia boudieri ATCC MYA-4762]